MWTQPSFRTTVLALSSKKGVPYWISTMQTEHLTTTEMTIWPLTCLWFETIHDLLWTLTFKSLGNHTGVVEIQLLISVKWEVYRQREETKTLCVRLRQDKMILACWSCSHVVYALMVMPLTLMVLEEACCSPKWRLTLRHFCKTTYNGIIKKWEITNDKWVSCSFKKKKKKYYN